MIDELIHDVNAWIEKNDDIWGVDNPLPVNLPSGDWSSFLPTFEPQSFNGLDTNECSQLSAINAVETYMNMLKDTGQMTANQLNFWITSGALDSNNKFAFSEDLTGILDGTSINGNIAQNSWKCFQKYGLLPRSKLNWTTEQASHYPDQESMDLAYYSPTRITPDMELLAKETKKYINISWGWIADSSSSIPLNVLSNGLKTSPLQYVIPIPVPVSDWNMIEVPYTGGTNLQHCVTGYKIDTTGVSFPYYITDQYQPWLKQLQSTYYIPIAIAFNIQLLV